MFKYTIGIGVVAVAGTITAIAFFQIFELPLKTRSAETSPTPQPTRLEATVGLPRAKTLEEKTAENTFSLGEPIAEFKPRITKKPFGIYITPETSPVQPDRFTGYHTGVDVEYEDVPGDISVKAIADGTIVVSKFVSGYGGVIVISHMVNGGPALALYGHLDPQQLPKKGTAVKQGELIGILGAGNTPETDGARKHLHFALLRKEAIDIRGYVQTQEELAGWYDPEDFYPQTVSRVELPDEINLAVPFTPQAPHANWDLPYQEACEEASVLMLARYKKGEPIRSADDADAEIKTLVAFQEKFLGFYKDTTAEETMRWANEYYGFTDSRVVYDFSIDDLKQELAKGNPVILPAAGRLLPNPYFRDPGPLYHMLVVRGYTKDGLIITNDPGTKRGEQFVYHPDDLLNAVHDWNGGDVLNGRSVMIVLE